MKNFGCFFQGNIGDAIIEQHTGDVYTYSELDDMCDKVARSLMSMGLNPNERIAIVADNSVRYIALMFGAMRAGIGVVTIDNKLPIDKQEELIKDSNCVEVFDDALIDNDWCHFIDDEFLYDLPIVPDENMIADIQYTSGSTGKPKGVMRTHANENWYVNAQQWAIPHKRHILATKLHLAGGLHELMTIMKWGGTVVLLKTFTPKIYLDCISKYKLWAVHGVPAVHKLIMSAIKQYDIDVSSVREVRTSGDIVTPALVDEINEVYNNPKFIHRYSTTEGGRVFHHSVGHNFGKPYEGSNVKLVDGELWHKSPAVFIGYLNQPKETDKVLEDGWYKTNDIMKVDDDGYYWYIGRKNDAFSVKGKTVYPQEVSLILEQHPAVHQAVCVPIPDEKRTNVVIAFVVMEKQIYSDPAWESLHPHIDELVNWFKENGSDHAKPKHYIFLDEIPVNETKMHKIDISALKELAHDHIKSINLSH
jgi:acyl-coenzyme A synthetase/AMP-(fatty) acid ligase